MPHCTAILAFNGDGFVKHVRCGRWQCPHCGKINAKLWAWRVKLELGEQTWYMWTLTLGSKYKTPEQGFKAWPKLWNRLRMKVTRYYQKRYGKQWKWKYCAFVEGQRKSRDGMPHFHIVTNIINPTVIVTKNDRKSGKKRKVESKRIKDFAVSVGFGFEAKLQEVSDKKAAYYVAKYASKGSPDMPKNFRRVRTSQDWEHLPDYEGGILYVKAYKENLTDYFLRVSANTGVDVDDLWERWRFANELDGDED